MVIDFKMAVQTASHSVMPPGPGTCGSLLDQCTRRVFASPGNAKPSFYVFLIAFVVGTAVVIPVSSADEKGTGHDAVINPEPQPDIAATDDPRLNGPVLKDHANLSETLRAVVLTAIPDQYEDLRQWGRTREVFGGVRMQQHGLNIRFSEKKRKVNHGMWHRYKIELIDPARHLNLTIDRIRPLTAGRFAFQIHLRSKLRCRGDFEHWVLGVKGLNFTIVSEADVELIADCELAIQTKLNRGSLLPDLVLDPKVSRVQLFLKEIDVRRIGEIRGDIAESVGDMSRHDIENLLQAQEERVKRKMNEAINKNRDRLKIPASRLW